MTRPIDENILTAYALDECSPEERAEVEALLRRSPSTEALVSSLRELAALAEEALVEEPNLLDDQRQAIMDAAEARDHSPGALPRVSAPMPLPPPSAPPADKVIPLRPRRRALIWTLRGLAAAAVLTIAVSVPLTMLMRSPGSRVAQAPVSSADYGSTASMVSERKDPEAERKQLLQELQQNMREAGVKTDPNGAVPTPADLPQALSPTQKAQLIREGRLPSPNGTLEGLSQDELDNLAASSRRTVNIEEARLRMRQSREYRSDEGEALRSTYHEEITIVASGRTAKPKAVETSAEQYNPITHNDYALVTDSPLSTFSIDVDTASYANVRRFLEHYTLPPASAVRIEELINYFDYGYTPPSGDAPFATQVEIASCPWNPEHRLARIGIKGRVVDTGALPPSNLVFLLDVSGSMSAQNKLPLVQQAIRLLVHELDERDRVAIVVYAGSSGLVLPSTSGDDTQTILQALERLQAGGSTAGAAGIELAYQTAVANFIDGGVNRVVLATDGDFNVGINDQGALLELIEDRAKTGVYLTVLGFGMGNIKDGTLEQLADHGNGNYAYLDDLDEARKVLVTERGGTMMTIAKDVKIQVEFNPMQVHAYRLIGYENRTMAARDFDDDSKDAGEIGAGHTVTALYEVVPAGTDLAVPGAPVLKYQQPTSTTQAAASGELMTVKLRYKQPDGERSELQSFPITDGGTEWAHASRDFRHAAAVAAFGMLLRDSPHAGLTTWGLVQELAREGQARDPHGYRAEFGTLVRRARELSGE
jgi:Ca-activated chloride channel homolog